MQHLYTNLGAVPAIADPAVERRDAILSLTGPGARKVLRKIKQLPRRQQVAALDRVLERFDPELPSRVRRVAEHLHRQGMPTDRAVERALALSLADASIAKIKAIGVAHMRGEGVHRGMLGLGGSGLGTTTSQERSAEETVGDVFKGILCSNGLQESVSDLVGRNEGQDAATATNTGYEVAQGMAQCGVQTPEIPPPAPPTEPQERSLVLPIALGAGALLVVGGAVWYTTKKK